MKGMYRNHMQRNRDALNNPRSSEMRDSMHMVRARRLTRKNINRNYTGIDAIMLHRARNYIEAESNKSTAMLALVAAPVLFGAGYYLYSAMNKDKK